jgi:hypothetical protein
MPHDTIHAEPADSTSGAPATGEQFARQQAIRQIERRRRLWIGTTAWAIVMVLVTLSWAFSEYHNAGGWPTDGFSQSSRIPNVWNYWILYPLIAWVLGTAASAWYVFGRKPISEAQIKREMQRQAGRR